MDANLFYWVHNNALFFSLIIVYLLFARFLLEGLFKNIHYYTVLLYFIILCSLLFSPRSFEVN